MSWLLLLSLAVADGCEVAATSADLQGLIDTGRARYAALDAEQFGQTLSDLRASLLCVGEEIPQHVAAEIHRLQGLDAALSRDTARAEQAFAASRNLEPSYTFPTTLVPEDHPVRERFVALPTGGATEPIAAPATGRLVVDGRGVMERAVGLPILVQHLAEDGSVLDTAYVWPEDPLPVGMQPPAEPLAAPAPRKGGSKGLTVAAIATATTATVLYSGALLSKGQYMQTADPAKLEPLRARTNALVVASGVSMGVTLGLGTGAVLTARW